MKVIQEFRVLDEESLVDYIKEMPSLMAKLGNQLEALKIKEIGDGNINFVYTVVGTNGSFVVKQAVPYIRRAGESMPMTADRAHFEAQALKEHGRLCPNHVPEVYHTDRRMSLTAMRYLEPPHIILRQGLRAGIEYPLLAEHMSEYLARTLYFTSLLYRSTSEHKRSVAEFLGNIDLCRLTEKYVFSYPYVASQDNPFLPKASQNNLSHDNGNDAKAAHQDDSLKLEIAELKSMFCERAQALIHADLHTGSVMVTADSTQVIDPEFAFYGPMGFDIGSFLGNLMMAFLAQDAHASEENDRKEYKQWILKIVEETWNLFEKKFVSLWDEHKDGNGEAYLPDIYNSPKLQTLAQNKYMKDLFHDSLGFCGATLISLAALGHFEAFELITDAGKQACCKHHAFNLGKILVKERRRFESIGQVISAIQDLSST